jgi:riboflavin kinase/FMN adenylyltransferase
MEIFTELNKNPNLSLALGFFDGVHLGHKKVIESAVDFAKRNNTKSAVITFKNHPCCYLWDVKPKYILTRQARQEKIAELGVDFLYELDFESIAGLTAEDYLKSVLVDNFMPSAIFTGWNHNFGYKKSGDKKFLKENSKKFGYEYFELPPVKLISPPHPNPLPFGEGVEIISSTAIRKYLKDGKIEKANQMLGYNFSITGEVVKGNQIGRTIGFKTANIEYPAELIEIPFGVYTTIAHPRPLWEREEFVNERGEFTNSGEGLAPTLTPSAIGEGRLSAIANYGLRPTINGNKPVLEVHILDFDEDIYGETLEVDFLRMLRPERKFNSLDELKEQIKIDISSI